MLKSRKFQALLFDTVVSIVVMWITYLVDDPELKHLAITTIAAIKIPTAAYINGVAREDAAAKHGMAAAHATSGATAPTPHMTRPAQPDGNRAVFDVPTEV